MSRDGAALRARVALLTPLPPAPAGSADAIGALCAALGARVELHLFTPTRAPAPVGGAASLRPLSVLPFRAGSFDRVVSVLGNAPCHDAIVRLFLDHGGSHGGAAILRDAHLLGSALRRGGSGGVRRLAAAELARPVPAAEVAAWVADESLLPTLLLSAITAAAAPLFVHSTASAREIRLRYGVVPRLLPVPPARLWSDAALAPAACAAARGRLGIGPGEFALVSCGGPAASEGGTALLWALDCLRARGMAARLCFAGAAAGPEAEEARALRAELGLGGWVEVPAAPWSEAAWQDRLLAADAAVALRGFGFGQAADALADALAAGLPTIANQGLAAAMEAPGFVRTIPDRLSPVLLAEALAGLRTAGPAARASAARTAWQEGRRPQAGAAALLAGLGLAEAGA